MADRLLAYAFGALHAALLLWLVVVLLVATGSASAFANIGTGPGLSLGVWLAAVSWGATAWALRGLALDATRAQDVLGRAAVAGFAAGALFVVGAFLGGILVAGELVLGAFLFPILAAPFAGAFGCLVALLLAGLDLGLYALARRAIATP